MDDSNEMLTTFATLVSIIPLIVESAKKMLGMNSNTNNKVIIAISWLIGIIICVLAWLLDVGAFTEMPFYKALMWGLAASLASNGVADTKIIKGLFSIFNKRNVQG